MSEKDDFDTENYPSGRTVSIGEAARLLNTSRSTLKRKGTEWGLSIFWDGRGRRYSVRELEELRRGEPLESRKPDTISQHVGAAYKHLAPTGYRFRVYGTGSNKGYLGFFSGQSYFDVTSRIQKDFGHGRYYLKLVDEDGNMTGDTFWADMADPSDDESWDRLEILRNTRALTRIFRSCIRQLQRYIE